jgi:hypothetical protein
MLPVEDEGIIKAACTWLLEDPPASWQISEEMPTTGLSAGAKFGHLDRGTPEGVRAVTNTFLDGDHARGFPDYPQGILSLTPLERYKGCDRPTFV